MLNYLKVNQFYFLESSEKKIFQLKSSKNIFVYCVNGTATLKINKIPFKLCSNDYLVIPHNMPSILITEKSEVFYFDFDCSDSIESIYNSVFTDQDQNILFFSKQLSKLIDNIFDEFKAEYITSYQNLIFLQLLYNFNCIENKCAQNISKIVMETITYFRENFHQNIHIETLFSSYGYSYVYMRRLFKSETGLSPNAFLMKIRLNASIELLTNTNYTLKTIAEKCGFSSTRHFSSFFYKQKGITPKEFRLQQKRCTHE